MYIQFIFILVAICILTLSITKYKEGQCVKAGTPEAEKVQIRANTINKRISGQNAALRSINSRVNQILLNYSDFKFSIKSVDVDSKSTLANLNIDHSKDASVSNPSFIFTLVTSPKGDMGDPGNQGLTGVQGPRGDSGSNGVSGYWGQRGGCSK